MSFYHVFVAAVTIMMQCVNCLPHNLSKRSHRCSDPDVVGDMAFGAYIDIIKTQAFSSALGWRPNDDESINSIPKEFIKIEHKHKIGGHKCDANGHSIARHASKKRHQNRNLHTSSRLYQLSFCEWKYEANIDFNRKPEVLQEAKCTCPKPSKKYPDVLCENVVQYVKVFRRNRCIDGVYEYKKVWEPVTVACVPIHPPTKHNIEESLYRTQD